MNLLALDTSTELCSVALWRAGEIVERAEWVGNRHSEVLLPMARGLMAECGMQLSDLDGLACGIGPGSFTGLRIGCGVAQGLAFAADIPVLGVVTLEAMALDLARRSGVANVLACIDARMNEVYAAAYRVEVGPPLEIVPPCVLPPARLCLPPGGGWVGGGTGFSAYGEILRQGLGGLLAGVEADVHPRAGVLLDLARPRFEAGEGGPAETLEPFYVRDKVALTVAERKP